MLEKMAEFFDSRLDGYDTHQLTCIDCARDFYSFSAASLPGDPGIHILDLGCGTGLELEAYFLRNPSARITGIDPAPGMLRTLNEKFPDKDLHLILGSYFDVPFGEDAYDAAISVESLHHFTRDEKIPLYRKLHRALKDGGYLILTDYFSLSDAEEQTHRQELLRLKALQGIRDDALYHFDTPLTVPHETQALLEAGFSSVEILNHWGATFTLKAVK